MKIIDSFLNGCLIFQLQSYHDERGYFQEIYHEKKYQEFIPANTKFLQDNLSKSKKDVIRGIHFQTKNPQGKLVRVVYGKVFDVAVDLRLKSDTFGKYYSVILSDENHKQIWIPEGFGHGFMTLSDEAILEYKCTDFYNPECENTILWNDPDLAIEWPIREQVIISTKDRSGLSFSEIKNLIES